MTIGKNQYRQFTIHSEEWANNKQLHAKGPNGEDRITLRLMGHSGACLGACDIEWWQVNGILTPRVVAPNEGWRVLAAFADVLEALGGYQGDAPNKDTIVSMLHGLGIPDGTSRDSQQHATVSASIVEHAGLLVAYTESLNHFRKLARVVTGEKNWAENVEYGNHFGKPTSLSMDAFREVEHLAKSIQYHRCMLQDDLNQFGEEAIKGFKETEFDSPTQAIEFYQYLVYQHQN